MQLDFLANIISIRSGSERNLREGGEHSPAGGHARRRQFAEHQKQRLCQCRKPPAADRIRIRVLQSHSHTAIDLSREPAANPCCALNWLRCILSGQPPRHHQQNPTPTQHQWVSSTTCGPGCASGCSRRWIMVRSDKAHTLGGPWALPDDAWLQLATPPNPNTTHTHPTRTLALIRPQRTDRLAGG